MDSQSHCALVTGGESGIGRACALALAHAGHPVALTYHSDQAAGDAVVAEIEQSGGRALACRTDVTEEAAVKGVLGADLVGPFLTCRRFVRGLAAGGGERIVNVSSIHERAPRAGGADYDSAKGGLAQLTATLALELAPQRIAVNAVAPGMILTPMNQSALDDPEELRRKEEAIPWGRAGTPEEVSALVLFLLSPSADYLTGTTVTIDGGLSLIVAQGA